MDEVLSEEEWRELAERRWTEVDARVALAAWRRSGDSAYAFARDHGLNAQRLHWWCRRLEEWEEPEADLPATLVEAELIAAPASAASVRVHTRSGHLVEVAAAEVDARWVAELVRGLEDAPR